MSKRMTGEILNLIDEFVQAIRLGFPDRNRLAVLEDGIDRSSERRVKRLAGPEQKEQ